MKIEFLIGELIKNAGLFNSIFLTYDGNNNFIKWKPNPDKWCLLEILCHLIDEEKEDFRTRVKFALENSNDQPSSIDPQGWVISRNYINQNYTQKCNEYKQERTNSIEWLNSLKNENWNAFFTHLKFGKMTAHYMLTNWLAHDFLHIKQITKLRYDYLAQSSGEKLDYAGNWT